MGLIGGSSSNLQTTNNTETNNLNLQDIRGGQTLAGIKNSTINLSDHGAIAGAFNATNEALTFAQKAGENALDFAFNAGTPDAANTKVFIYAAGAAAVAFALARYGKKRK